MDKNQDSRETHACVLSTGNKQLAWARILFLAIFLAFGLAGVQAIPSAEASDRGFGRDQTGVSDHQAIPSVEASDRAFGRDQTGASDHQPNAAPRYARSCESQLVDCLSSGAGAVCFDQYEICINGGKIDLIKKR